MRLTEDQEEWARKLAESFSMDYGRIEIIIEAHKVKRIRDERDRLPPESETRRRA